MSEKIKILDSQQVERKIKRIAYEVYENNFSEKEIYMVGIIGGGYKFAEKLAKVLAEISELKVHLYPLEIDKVNPHKVAASVPDLDLNQLESKVLVLVDDVLNTAKTLAYGFKPFLTINLAKLETVVLVNRSHSKYPISATYSGHELPTMINEHIEVEIEDEKAEVFIY